MKWWLIAAVTLLKDESSSRGCCSLRKDSAASFVSDSKTLDTGCDGILVRGRLVIKSPSLETYLIVSFLFRAGWTLGWKVSMSKKSALRICFLSGRAMKACK